MGGREPVGAGLGWRRPAENKVERVGVIQRGGKARMIQPKSKRGGLYIKGRKKHYICTLCDTYV